MYLHAYCENIVKEFYFPDVLDGRFSVDLYNYETKLRTNIQLSVYVSNGVWKLVSKNKYEIVGLKPGQECPLSPDISIKVHMFEANVSLVIIPTKLDSGFVNYKKFLAENRTSIHIGRNRENIISFDSSLISQNHAEISYRDRQAYIEDLRSHNGVHLNGKKISGATLLHFGDIIYICGLKIIYLDNLIAINNPYNKVSVKLYGYTPPVSNTITEDSPEEAQPEEEQYFTRSPRIVKRFESEPQEIDPPPQRKEQRQPPVLLQIGPSLTMGIGMMISLMVTITSSASGNMAATIAGVVTTVAMLSGAIIFPIAMKNYTEKQAAIEENQRKNRYMSYITNLELKIGKNSEYNRGVLEELYPDVSLCVNRVHSIDRRLWERNPQNEDFLDIRVGIGARDQLFEITVPKERFTLEEDPLRTESIRIQNKFKYLENAPISLNLRTDHMVGFIGLKDRLYDLARAMVVQAATLHCYDEVKLCFIYTIENAPEWDFVQWLPHTFTKYKDIRLISSKEDQLRTVLYYLDSMLDERKTQMKDINNQTVMLPHYLIFVANNKAVEKEPIFKRIAEEGDKLGVSIVFISEKIDLLPSSCNIILQCNDAESYVYNKNDKSGLMQSFAADTTGNIDMAAFAKKLLNINVREQSESSAVPESLTFFELYGADVVEDMIISQRWEQNLSYKTLDAPIGIASGDEVFSLNIHEKFHGPHGLIAGTTGSGKSEFIQSYILSMAVNYHPHYVSFILIDYKGGGMANLFKELPHVAGTITNLDGNQVRRSLISLKAELARRQILFNNANVNNIDSYQRLHKEKREKAGVPLPHLVIISDEFAELKANQPDFMQELVSTARIGRSLGVHLILATQKPSGVVDDQIWSNTRFRICLKVGDKLDSIEMLKRPDASQIVQKGRAYVQVGNDEIFRLIQGGWSGAPYLSANNLGSGKLNQSVELLNLCAQIEGFAEPKENVMKTEDTQLSATVKFISEYSTRKGLASPKLWLQPLAKIINWHDLNRKNRDGGFNGEEWIATDSWLNPAIGLYDDPKTQTQEVLSVNIGLHGHVALYGAPGTGKTTFLQTIIYALAQSYSPNIVHMYMLDFGGRSTEYFKTLPHFGDVIFSDDDEKIVKFFRMLKRELANRKKQFAEYGVGNIKSYIEASGKHLPAIIVFLDNYAAFAEMFLDYEPDIILLSREGGNYGIYQVFTGNSSNAIKIRITQNYKLHYALQLNDRFDYLNIVGQTDGLTPEPVKGRGLAKLQYPVEFQTAIPFGAENESERVNRLRDAFSLMNEKWKGERARAVPMPPENLSLEYLNNTDDYR
ncbi:MAG: type VII secretion protein EssC, partial [Clostridiales bacterium]|nr:type VII secretion protein EssC [Clostridiales bacterium]